MRERSNDGIKERRRGTNGENLLCVADNGSFSRETVGSDLRDERRVRSHFVKCRVPCAVAAASAVAGFVISEQRRPHNPLGSTVCAHVRFRTRFFEGLNPNRKKPLIVAITFIWLLYRSFSVGDVLAHAHPRLPETQIDAARKGCVLLS